MGNLLGLTRPKFRAIRPLCPPYLVASTIHRIFLTLTGCKGHQDRCRSFNTNLSNLSDFLLNMDFYTDVRYRTTPKKSAPVDRRGSS